VELQRLATQSIGMKEASRLRGLIFEQSQLISELRLIQKHLEELDAEIGQIVEHCRKGKILTSIPPVGPLQAAMIIAAIGSIGNFESAAKLKSYFGWAPIREQTDEKDNVPAHLDSDQDRDAVGGIVSSSGATVVLF